VESFEKLKVNITEDEKFTGKEILIKNSRNYSSNIEVKEFSEFFSNKFNETVSETKTTHEPISKSIPESSTLHKPIPKSIPESSTVHKPIPKYIPEFNTVHEHIPQTIPETTPATVPLPLPLISLHIKPENSLQRPSNLKPKKENNVNKRENITRKDEDKNQETQKNIWSVISSYYNEKVGCTLEIDVFKKVTQKEAEKEMKQEENGEKLIIYISD
ncbi:hypothetical protein CWI37_0083p0020, partial [Hamiltosporidium tvaerminnensis]